MDLNRTFAAVLILSACADGPVDSATPDPVVDTAVTPSYTDWSWSDDDTASYEPNAADAMMSLQSVASGLRDVRASTIYDSYKEAMMEGESTCPKETVNVDDAYGTVSYWVGACETLDHVIFKGPMTEWVFEDIDLESTVATVFGRSVGAPGDSWTGYGMQGQGNIMDTQTIDYNCSCTSITATSTTDDTVSYLNMLTGESHWTGPAASDNWMAWGWNVEATVIYSYTASTQGTQANGSAEVDGLLGRYSSASLRFDVSAIPAGDSVTCTVNDGNLSATVRDSITSTWYDIVLTATPGSCMVCATKSELGELCIDLAPLVQWSETPW